MVKVKVCGITNLEDALAAVEYGADALGFNFYEQSSRFISTAEARLIIERLPEQFLCVGVFVNQPTPAHVLRAAREAGIGAIQLHGDESPDYCRSLEEYQIIKALRVGASFRPEWAASFSTDAVLLDAFSPTARGGTGETFDWALARQTKSYVRKLYLAGGLTPETVALAVEEVDPYAVDVCSGIESRPGVKDHRRMLAFIEAAHLSLRN